MRNKALLLFSDLPEKEALRKRVFPDRKRSESLAGIIFNKTVNTVRQCREKIDFDFIIATKENDPRLKTLAYSVDNVIGFKGRSFGEKFANSIEDVFNLGYKSVVVIGDDIPDLSSEHITKSFECLNEMDNAVVGPSADGGFYLLGINSFDMDFFKGIKWRTKNVFCMLEENLTRQNYVIKFLPVLTDIDDNNSLNLWFSIKTEAGKIIKRLLLPETKFISLFLKCTVPFIKDVYFSKRVSQKSPPLFN